MSETTTTDTGTGAKKTNKTPSSRKPNLSRKTIGAIARKKRAAKLKSDKEFAKAFHAAKSKRSTDKKAAFRKKKRGKK